MRFEQEQDRVPVGKVLVATVIVLAVSAVFIGAAGLLTTAPKPVSQPIELGSAEEVNDVEAHHFDEMTAAERQALAAQARLSSYGWVDKEQQIIHIPIEVAADLYLSDGEEQP